MFFQPPETESKIPVNSGKSSASQKSARRKRKKRAQKYNIKKLALKKEKQRFANTMSSWAESFTIAATWQLKHQVAHWKSKARALEYENIILRDMLRQYYVKGNVSEISQNNKVTQRTEAMSVTSDTDDDDDDDYTENNEEEEEGEDVQDEENIEISEEFIDFLKGNAEFRKKRLERERLRQLEEEMPMKKLEACPDAQPDRKEEEYQELYGDKWQRIAALEMSMQSQFMSDCDRDKPSLWPILPLRF